MANDLRDLEHGWAAGGGDRVETADGRTRRLVGWWLLTASMVLAWAAAWLGGGAALGGALQALYGIDAAVAPLWLRADAHLHAAVALLITVWAAWAGRLFTPIGSWLGPPVAIVVAICDELLQLGQADRSFEWGDELAGVVGILLGTVALLLFHARRPRSR